MDADVKVELVEPDGDAEALDGLMHNLWQELLQLDVRLKPAVLQAGPDVVEPIAHECRIKHP